MKRVCTLVFLCALGSPVCFGGSVGPVLTFSFSSTNFVGHGFTQTVGWGFTVNQAVTVTDLFWYDPNEVLTTGFPVDIWTSGGSVVASTSCVGFGCSGGSYDPWGYWETPITSVVLSPGGYVIGGLIGPNDKIEDSISSFTTSDFRISYTQDLATIAGSLTMPTSENGGQEKGYFGPNFGVSVPFTGVPEPGTFALLGLGLVGLPALFRRRNS
jgi:hypothetical protein